MAFASPVGEPISRIFKNPFVLSDGGPFSLWSTLSRHLSCISRPGRGSGPGPGLGALEDSGQSAPWSGRAAPRCPSFPICAVGQHVSRPHGDTRTALSTRQLTQSPSQMPGCEGCPQGRSWGGGGGTKLR